MEEKIIFSKDRVGVASVTCSRSFPFTERELSGDKIPAGSACHIDIQVEDTGETENHESTHIYQRSSMRCFMRSSQSTVSAAPRDDCLQPSNWSGLFLLFP